LEWAHVKAMAADGISQRQIAGEAGHQPPHGQAAAWVRRAAAVSAGACGFEARSV